MAAERILIEDGPQNLKLVEVAGKAGLVNATVLHHFGSIGGLQTALMTRMIEQLVTRVLAISAATTDLGELAGAGTLALFDAFETRGVARLAAWLEMTGEARRLTVVREAVREVVSARDETANGVTPEMLEDFILICISVALGVGLFGPTLGALLDKSESRAREMALPLLLGLAQNALSSGAE
jgi:AcrR family transcriptional regulator